LSAESSFIPRALAVVHEGGVAPANRLPDADLREVFLPAQGLFRVAGDAAEKGANCETIAVGACKVASVKERIKELVDELPDPAAVEVEQLLLSLTGKRDEADWKRLASAAFASWFSEEEYEYPDEPVANR